MAYPSSHSFSHGTSHPNGQLRAVGQPSNVGQSRTPSAHPTPTSSHSRRSFGGASAEGEHQLEKLEFALAVALTRGDLDRSHQLREAIAALGGNQEEPGT